MRWLRVCFYTTDMERQSAAAVNFEQDFNTDLVSQIDPADIAQWAQYAECKDVSDDIFHSTRVAAEEKAKEFCYDCDVQPQCLTYALSRSDEPGIWGGTTEEERRVIRRQRRYAQVAIKHSTI